MGLDAKFATPPQVVYPSKQPPASTDSSMSNGEDGSSRGRPDAKRELHKASVKQALMDAVAEMIIATPEFNEGHEVGCVGKGIELLLLRSRTTGMRKNKSCDFLLMCMSLW